MGIPYAEVIGDPIGHSKSPLIHNFWLGSLGLDGHYRATRVRRGTVGQYLSERRGDPDWHGCNVTMPLKTEVMSLVDECSDEAARSGAVNAVSVRRGMLWGTNFDAEAVVKILSARGVSGGSAVLIGSGGAARAALLALSLLRLDRVSVMSRNHEAARAMAVDLRIEADILPLDGEPDCGLLINATPLGMRGWPPLDVSLGGMGPKAIVFDMVYDPLITPLVADARRRGLEILDGLEMLIEQAAMSFVSFFNRSPDLELRRRARELLTS